MFISFNSNIARSPASRVVILIDRQWTSYSFQKICVNGRVIVADVKVPNKIIVIMAAYLVHSGYAWKLLSRDPDGY